MKNRIAILALFPVAAAIAFPSQARAKQTAPSQEAPAPSSAEPAQSVWDGVYTKEQASRGEALYAQRCARCHGPDLTGGEIAPALNSGEFKSNWSGLSVDDLFERIKVSMPQDNPGSLSRQQTADVVAFVLSKNGFPAGKKELAREAEVVKQIRFELIAGVPNIGSAQSVDAPFSIRINAPQAASRVGSEVRIDAVITNITDQEIWVPVEKGSRGEFDFKIDLRDSAGLVPAETIYYRAVKGEPQTGSPILVVTASGGPLPVKPQGTLTDVIQVDKLYDLSKPDKYTIQVERYDDLTKTIVESNKITFVITP